LIDAVEAAYSIRHPHPGEADAPVLVDAYLTKGGFKDHAPVTAKHCKWLKHFIF
jgi:hypothetical protein